MKTVLVILVALAYFLGYRTGVHEGVHRAQQETTKLFGYVVDPGQTYETAGYVTVHCPQGWTLRAEDWKCHNPWGAPHAY